MLKTKMHVKNQSKQNVNDRLKPHFHFRTAVVRHGLVYTVILSFGQFVIHEIYVSLPAKRWIIAIIATGEPPLP